MEEVSHRALFVRGRGAYDWFRVIFFGIMSHLSKTAVGFGEDVVRRKLLYCKTGEHISVSRAGAHVSENALQFLCVERLCRSVRAEPSAAADCLQRPLVPRSRCSPQLMRGVAMTSNVKGREQLFLGLHPCFHLCA